MEIFLAKTQGFCAGVENAVRIVESALEKYGAPLYVFHEIVHNTHVVNAFRERGVAFVDSLEDVPPGERIIFSAHGIPPYVLQQAAERQLECIDATCPLVKKVHQEALSYSGQGCHVVLIGHKGHQEVIGTSGYVNQDLLHIVENLDDIKSLPISPDSPLAYLTQTTLSVDETKEMLNHLRERFPQIHGPSREDICYATQRRQDAVKDLAQKTELIIVCGSPSSSNSNRLRETGEAAGVKSIIIDSADELDLDALQGVSKIGISSGASVPRHIVDELLDRIKTQYPDTIVHVPEKHQKTTFPLPEI